MYIVIFAVDFINLIKQLKKYCKAQSWYKKRFKTSLIRTLYIYTK